MIVSHEYKYVFVELPHTASTAVSRELCEIYKGESVLTKHAHYRDFQKIASVAEESYSVVAGMRNPLDFTVTRYFKRKTNHAGFFTDPKFWRKNGGFVSNKDLLEYQFIRENDADYPAYFRRFYRYSFDSWGCPSPTDFDFVIYYENLQEDFGKFLEMLNIPQVRPLPLVNKTAEKEKNFWDYYPPSLHKQAVYVFGMYLKLWGYKFPADWGDISIPAYVRIEFKVLRWLKMILIGSGFYYKSV